MSDQFSATKHVVSGVLLIDKPQGLSSQQVVSRVKYLLKSLRHDSKKAGHTGTLDPMATGLLPICLGEATKFSHYQLEAVKSYHAIIQLGSQTDTGDAEGQVIAQAAVPTLSQRQLDAVVQRFLGQQQQTPPMYSALKHEGKKLYELARAGIDIERQPRCITIIQLQLTQVHPDQLAVEVTCSKGTYVRVLAEDIALALGTLGHLIALRRLATGQFTIAQAITLEAFANLTLEQRLQRLLPTDACVTQFAKLSLTAEQAQRIAHGQRLNVKSILPADLAATSLQTVRLYCGDKFLGLGELADTGRLQPVKLVR